MTRRKREMRPIEWHEECARNQRQTASQRIENARRELAAGQELLVKLAELELKIAFARQRGDKEMPI